MGRYAFDWEGQGGRAGASRDDPPQGSFRDPKEGWRGSPPLPEPPPQQELTMSQTSHEKAARDMRQTNQSTGKVQGQASDAQHELNDPDQAKARPKSHGPSNAGEDGGA